MAHTINRSGYINIIANCYIGLASRYTTVPHRHNIYKQVNNKRNGMVIAKRHNSYQNFYNRASDSMAVHNASGLNLWQLSKSNNRRKNSAQIVATRCVHTISPDIPCVSIIDMKRALKQSGRPLVDGYTALAVACAVCEGEPGTMYINKTTGHFICGKCENQGTWSMLERILKKGLSDENIKEHFAAIQEERRAFQTSWEALLKETTPLGELAAEEVETLFALFEYPYFADAPKALSEVRCDATRTTLYFPLASAAERVVAYRALRAGLEDRPEVRGHVAAGLFSCRAVRTARGDRAVLVPTVKDILYLAKDKVPGSLVWWCSGLLPPPALAVLEAYKRVVVWGGAENLRGVGDKLGQDRCRFVRAIDGGTTASEAAEGVEGRGGAGRLRAAVAEAAPAAHRSITTFSALRGDVYANVTNAERVRGVKWSRFPALNRLLGGHRRGELTVLTGATGCGKTTLTAEMSLDLATCGVNTLWGSFEIRNSRLAQTMLQQHAGVSLEENIEQFDTYADEFERLPIYFLAFHGPQPVATVMEAVEHARYVHDIAHVIIDNVQFMLGVGADRTERFFRQDGVVAAFRAFATRRDCHVTLVMHPRKEREEEDLSTSSIFGSAKASQEADNVLIIQDRRLTAVRGKKYLQVAKNRFSGDLGIVPLEFDKAALSYRAKKRTRDKDDQRQDADHRPGDHRPDIDQRQDADHRPDKDHRQDADQRQNAGQRQDADQRQDSDHRQDADQRRGTGQKHDADHRQDADQRQGTGQRGKTGHRQDIGRRQRGDSYLRDVLESDNENR